MPLPAGLEAVDTSLASTAKLPQAPTEEGPTPSADYESDEETGEAHLVPDALDHTRARATQEELALRIPLESVEPMQALA